MRLLDYIAQSRAPFLVERASGVVCRLRSACDFAGQIATCPLRYVLSDELARTCAALAYTENRQLIDCLDLVRLPAERLWVEWPDAARRDELLRATPRITTDRPAVDVLRAGALIRASRSGRSGAMILFWTTRDRPNDPLVAALDTHFDLDGNLPESGNLYALFDGALTGIRTGSGDCSHAIQSCVRYQFDRSWRQYYAQDALSTEARDEVLRDSLATVANDLPMVLALSLLLAARDGLSATPSNLERLNAKRRRLGKRLLLEHVEISVAISADEDVRIEPAAGAWRRAPRLHHVRGHVVRRANTIYWRAPHWRGHVRLGRVRTRTVSLQLAPAQGRATTGDHGIIGTVASTPAPAT